MTLKQVVDSTSTAQMRRVTIPLHRRKMQAKQTVIGIAVGMAGMLFVKWMGLSEGWYVAAALLGARIASKEYLRDALRIFREILGGKNA